MRLRPALEEAVTYKQPKHGAVRTTKNGGYVLVEWDEDKACYIGYQTGEEPYPTNDDFIKLVTDAGYDDWRPVSNFILEN